MSSESPWIGETQRQLGALIKKPKLAGKLLKRPPLRYIRDIVVNVQKATGFPEGLFTSDVLQADSKAIKAWTKQFKIDFLSRLHKGVEAALGESIDFRAEMAASGQEPEKTNQVLQGLAKAATLCLDAEITMGEVLSRLEGGGDDDGAAEAEAEAARRAAEKEAEERRRAAAREKAAKEADARREAREKADAARRIAEAEERARRASAAAVERPPARSGSRSSGGEEGSIRPAGSLEEAIQQTQGALSKLIKRPALTEQLLRRPPIRYIHDVFNSLQASTGLMKGLFSAKELDRRAFKGADKRSKAIFVKKLIRLTSVAVGQELDVQLKMVMSGKEPIKTNMLFQALAAAAARGVSSEEIKSRLRGGGGAATAARPEPAPQPEVERPKPAALKPAEPEPAGGSDDLRAAAMQAASQPMPKLDIGGAMPKPSTAASSDALDGGDLAGAASAEPARPTTRPMTARRAPPKVRSHLVEEKKSHIADSDASTRGVITEDNKELSDDDEDDDEDQDQLPGFESKGAIEQGGQHGKLVSDILRFQGQHETNTKAYDDARRGDADAADGSGTQFRFGRLKRGRAGGQATTSFYSAEQIVLLREKIQQLCQSATPLGKCIGFVTEDMESMSRELSQWNRMYRDQRSRLQVELQRTDETLAPLAEQLRKLENEILREKQKAAQIEGQILRNESVIEAQLRNQSGN